MLNRWDLDYRWACDRGWVSIAPRIVIQTAGLRIDGSMLMGVDCANATITSLYHATDAIN